VDGIPKCPNGTIALTHSTTVNLLPARCNRWACSRCGPRKARRLRKRLERSRPNRLVTLTLRPDPSLTPREQLAIANHAWSILWRRLRRKHGRNAVGYAKIVELTKAGTPHLHIIVQSPFIEQRWLSAAWLELTGSFIVDVRHVQKRKGVAGYLTAYLTKALAVPPGMRKWSAARHFVPPTPEPPLEEGELPPVGSWHRASLLKLSAAYLAGGYTYDGDWLIPPSQPLRPPSGPPRSVVRA
jgi:hypothetical protein